MGKKSMPRPVADNEARAVVKNIRISPQKLNLLAQSIRGVEVSEYRMMLKKLSNQQSQTPKIIIL